jgi:hypothetical protein
MTVELAWNWHVVCLPYVFVELRVVAPAIIIKSDIQDAVDHPIASKVCNVSCVASRTKAVKAIKSVNETHFSRYRLPPDECAIGASQ